MARAPLLEPDEIYLIKGLYNDGHPPRKIAKALHDLSGRKTSPASISALIYTHLKEKPQAPIPDHAVFEEDDYTWMGLPGGLKVIPTTEPGWYEVTSSPSYP